jgi:type I restriction enzyme S subunit
VIDTELELPNGWVETKLDDISELIGGGTPSRPILEYFGGDIVWLTPTEIPKNMITVISNSREKITELGLKKSSAKIIPKNSVLLTSRASIGYVAIAGCDVTTNQGFASFVCSDVVHNLFLAYWLFGNKDLLESKATGTTFKEISKSKLKELEFKLPPLNEQKRIVSKIEELFSKIDYIKSLISLANNKLELLQTSILHQAFEGKLVPQDPDDEPASVLLERIKLKN